MWSINLFEVNRKVGKGERKRESKFKIVWRVAFHLENSVPLSALVNIFE